MSKRKLVESLPFKIDARVPIQLGRESISNSVVAISELVKNAYDADSEKVIVCFCLANNKKVLIIEDNGTGMDLKTLKKHWLLIGTDTKKINTRSKTKNRVLTGEKGLGRLGIDRLCKKLIMQTKQSYMDYVLELQVEWTKYEKRGVALSDVVHDIYTIPSSLTDSYGNMFTKNKSHGSRLVLTDLKDEWNEDQIDALRKELSLLVSPFSNIKDFTIVLKEDDQSEVLSSSWHLEASQWTLEAEFDTSNNLSFLATSKQFDQSQKRKIEWNAWNKKSPKKPKCGPFSFDLHYIPRTIEVLKAIDSNSANWREFMRSNQGIRIYRDKFRVKPYGEPSGKGDWLDLGIRRATSPGGVTQTGWKIGPHQVVGAVFISRERNIELEDQTNREGILEEDSFFDLRKIILKLIEEFEDIIHETAVRLKPVEIKEELKAMQEIKIGDSLKIIEELKSHVGKVTKKSERGKSIKAITVVLGQKFAEAYDQTKKYEEELAKEAERLKQEKDTLANLASIGILTVCFSHDIQEYVNFVATNSSNIRNLYKKGHIQASKAQEITLSSALNILNENASYIKSFSTFALENIKPDKRKRTNIYLNEVALYVFKVFNKTLSKKNISIDIEEIASNIKPIKAFEIDWESIFINLITNSIWALEDKNKENRKIKVTISCNDKNVRVVFSDSGIGIEKGTEKKIFLPMFSTKRDYKGNIIGTGMGLAIVKLFIEEHSSGTIEVKSPGMLGGADLYIGIPIA